MKEFVRKQLKDRFYHAENVKKIRITGFHQKHNKVSNSLNTMNSIIYDLQADGFVHTFSIIKDMIGCSGLRKLYKPAEIKIIKQNKYSANPFSSSGAIIYGLETYDGFKGILIKRSGFFADKAVEKFIQKHLHN